jgi:hypothetical protein
VLEDDAQDEDGELVERSGLFRRRRR